MQCYEGLPILTAQPTEAEQQAHPHALYGIWHPDRSGNAQEWAEAAAAEIKAAWKANRLPILVGGTGMYLRALLEGFHVMPEIDAAVRDAVRAMNQAERYAKLQALDARGADELHACDSQRVSRALEVVLSSGVPIHAWHEKPKQLPLPEAQVRSYVLDVPRDALYARIDTRFDSMMGRGALQEVQDFIQRFGQGSSPIYKACGFPELKAALNGAMPLEESVLKAKQHSRNYAKRQLTWARQQCAHWPRVLPDATKDVLAGL